MVVQFVAYCFAVAVGLAFSGTISSLWLVLTDEIPSKKMLYEGGVAAPIKGLVFVFGMPVRLMMNGVRLIRIKTAPALLAIFLAVGLSFIQGVVVLTKVFGAN